MDIQVVVAAMNQIDDSLVKKMNIQTDAIVCNQCDLCSNNCYQYDQFRVDYYNRPDRGVGLNRNVGVLHCKNDCIVTFADDDMHFVDGYAKIIEKAFCELPDADAIIFNINTVGTNMGRRINSKAMRVHLYNALNYGAARLSVKSIPLKKENILFHSCFGGGTRYGSGEDTIFIVDLLKHKLKVYVYPAYIAEVEQTNSTWFSGYDEKYFHDKGALFRAIFSRWAWVMCLQYLIRHKNEYKNASMSLKEAYKCMQQGMRNFESLGSY